MKRIVISDVHIGSKYYKSDVLIQFLREVEYDELILAGDIIDFQKVPEFSIRAEEIYNSLDFSKRIIYIPGNHDASLKGFNGQKVFGFEFMESYEFEEAGRNFRIEHGDRYDGKLYNSELFMKIVSIFHEALEHYLDTNITKWWTDLQIKRRKLRRIWDILQWNEDVDVFIMGHLHNPEFVIWGNGGKMLTYVNSGDWVSHSTYVSIVDGVVRLKTYGAENS
jgi:UDP-2,3-diacylglucosamine pyrophosphatase LpxH